MSAEQGTLDWHRERLGILTSSEIGNLIPKIKFDKEGNYIRQAIGKTGLSYLYEKAGERLLLEDIVSDDEKFALYLEETNYESRAMRLGKEREELARWVYGKRNKVEVTEVGLQKYYNIFGDSPDGLVLMDRSIGAIEIKCPSIGRHMLYCTMKEPKDLMEVEQDYFIQCHCHIIANNAEWCDFVSFNPLLSKDMHVLRILPDEKIKEFILGVLTDANDILASLTK